MIKMMLPVTSLLLVGVLTACGPSQQEQGQPEQQQQQDVQGELKTSDSHPSFDAAIDSSDMSREAYTELGLELRRTAGTPYADHPDQCKLVAMGRKPCGGPERYLMYSTNVLNADQEAEFLKKLQRYNQLSRKFNDNSGMVSDCQMIPEPGIVVRKGFCVPAEKTKM